MNLLIFIAIYLGQTCGFRVFWRVDIIYGYSGGLLWVVSLCVVCGAGASPWEGLFA